MPREAAGGGWIRGYLNIYVPLPAGTTAAEIVTDLVAGFKFTVEAVSYFAAVAATGAGASRTFRVLKGASTVVASRTLLLAEADTLGEQAALTVVPADATFLDGDVLTVDFASGGTAFTAGAGNLVIRYRTRMQQL